jgi:hypothetical protein
MSFMSDVLLRRHRRLVTRRWIAARSIRLTIDVILVSH